MISESEALAANLRYYEDHVEEYVNKTVVLDLSELIHAFLRHLSPGSRILDAGCGSGRDSASFLSLGFDVTSIDASLAMVNRCKLRGINALSMKFQEIKFDAEFEGVWACASLLHVPRSEIDDVLRRLVRALKPGGVILITLKEGTGEAIAPDGRFFSYYGLDEFEGILLRSGTWSNIHFRRDPGHVSKTWLNFLARKSIVANSALTLRPRNANAEFGAF